MEQRPLADPRPPGLRGRPRAGTAGALEARLLGHVWRLYVDGGYANVSYDAIAAAERMSKRTIYSRYPSKEALFRAAVARQFELWPREYRMAVDARLGDPVTGFIEFTLRALLTPDARAMTRILRGEERRFRDLAALARQRLEWTAERLTSLLKAAFPERDLDLGIIAPAIVDLLLGRTLYAPLDMRERELEHYIDTQLPSLLAVASSLTAGGRPPVGDASTPP